MQKRVLVAGVAALTLAGCGSNVKPGFVAKQWAGEMRELQINPVFPPREDFQVGDIYLPAVARTDVDEAIDEQGYLPISTWLTQAGGPRSVATQLKVFYDLRSTYPPTSKAVVQAVEQMSSGQSGTGGGDGGGNGNGGSQGPDLTGPVPQPVLDCENVDDARGTNCNIFTDDENTKLRRMRIVGFPTFLSTTITQGNLSAFVPIEAFSAALGLDFGDVKKVSVSVPVAESVGLPAMTVLELAQASFTQAASALCGTTDDNGERVTGSIRALLPDGQRVNGALPDSFHAMVVSEVFYTRAIEISVQTQQSFGLGARLQPSAPSGGGGAAGAAGQAGQQSGGQGQGDNGATGSSGQQSSDVPAALETLKRLKQSTSDLPSAPGGSLQIVSVSDGRVGMRRMFDRPIAIGYRGLSLQVDSATCKVIGGTPASTVVPTLKDLRG